MHLELSKLLRVVFIKRSFMSLVKEIISHRLYFKINLVQTYHLSS